MLTEHQAGKLTADVLQAPLPILEPLQEKGLLAACRPEALAAYPDWAQGDDRVFTFGVETVALIYSKEPVKAPDAPRRCEDLADPKRRDKIVMADPSSHATTTSWLAALKEKVFAEEASWRRFPQGLADSRPMFVASFGPAPAPIESGEKWIGISMPKYIVIRAPAPLDWARVEQPLFGSPRAMALAAAAPVRAPRGFLRNTVYPGKQ